MVAAIGQLSAWSVDTAALIPKGLAEKNASSDKMLKQDSWIDECNNDYLSGEYIYQSYVFVVVCFV
jgi:hypothetical protein